MVLEPPGGPDEEDEEEDEEGAPAAPPGPQQSALEALLAAGPSFPAMLHIPPDADDETMVELAIALSLQDQVFVHLFGVTLY